MTCIDRYISDLDARLRVGRRERTAILDEVCDHLTEAADTRCAGSVTRAQAESSATAAFGSVATIARGFNAASGSRAMRRAPLVALAAGAAVVGAFLVAANAQPRSSHSATPAMQVAFFLSVLSFQVALAAGARGASRALAMWRTAAASGEGRSLVQRSTIISMIALCAGAVAMALSFVLDARYTATTDGVALAAGAVAMIAAAAAGLVAVLRVNVNATDFDLEATRAETPCALSIGESAISLVRQYPVVSCATVALATSAWAMLQAETTLAGSLWWGVGEALTVIVAFVLLGPVLGLRHSRRDIHPT